MFWEFPIYNIKDSIGVIADFVSIFGIIIGGSYVYKKITIISNQIIFIDKNNNSYFLNKFYYNGSVAGDIIINKGIINK